LHDRRFDNLYVGRLIVRGLPATGTCYTMLKCGVGPVVEPDAHGANPEIERGTAGDPVSSAHRPVGHPLEGLVGLKVSSGGGSALSSTPRSRCHREITQVR